jgi:predicted DNA-binding transcriptional regulator YafY
LAASARSALARIRGVVPPDLLGQVDDARVYAPRFGRDGARINFDVVHRAIGERRRLAIDYAGEDGAPTSRTIRPLGLYFWGKVWTLAAWCELRTDFRSFRVDRIVAARASDPFVDEPDKTLEVYLARIRAAEGAERGATT